LWLALDALIVQYLNERDDWGDEQVAEFAQHFPSLKDVILLIWEHHITQPDAASPCTLCEPAPAAAS
jgi:hypothetical protein